jgi:hypothetical protein
VRVSHPYVMEAWKIRNAVSFLPSLLDPRTGSEVDRTLLLSSSLQYAPLLRGLMRRYMLTEVEIVSGIVLRTDTKRLQKDEAVKEASRFVLLSSPSYDYQRGTMLIICFFDIIGRLTMRLSDLSSPTPRDSVKPIPTPRFLISSRCRPSPSPPIRRVPSSYQIDRFANTNMCLSLHADHERPVHPSGVQSRRPGSGGHDQLGW